MPVDRPVERVVLGTTPVDLNEYHEPKPGDLLYIGDSDDGLPVGVEVETESHPMFMGFTDGKEVWT